MNSGSSSRDRRPREKTPIVGPLLLRARPLVAALCSNGYQRCSAMGSSSAISTWLRRLFPKKPLGQRGESAAARYLRRQGYKILARGDRLWPGELDLVALDRKTIVFVEVKTRQSQDAGHPSEAVNAAKQRRLTRLAVTFLKRHGLLEHPARFDIIAVTWPGGERRPVIEHFKNAFEAVGKWEFYS